MNRLPGARLLQWVIPFVLLLGLASCKGDTPEAALRAQLAQMQAAAAERRAGEFMDGVAEDFAGNEGMDRAALHNLLRMQLLRRAEVGITTGALQVEIKGNKAILRLRAVVSGGNGHIIPDSAQVYAVTSGWRLDAGQWRLYYAQWEPGL